MGKKEVLIGTLVVLILIGVTYIATLMMPSPQTSTPTSNEALRELSKKLEKNTLYYFWGDGCPHCKNLDDWVKSKGYDKSLTFKKLEVWKSRENARLMEAAALVCAVDREGMGVPFVYYKGKCYAGEIEAQDAFEKAFREKES